MLIHDVTKINTINKDAATSMWYQHMQQVGTQADGMLPKTSARNTMYNPVRWGSRVLWRGGMFTIHDATM